MRPCWRHPSCRAEIDVALMYCGETVPLFRAFRRRRNADSLSVVRERMTRARRGGPASAIPSASTACRVDEIEFGHINLCKKVFDLRGLTL